MPDLPFRIVVTDSGTAVVQRFAAQARKLGGVGRTVGRGLSRGFGLAQSAITGAVSRVFNLRNALLGLGVGLAIRKIVNVFGGFEKQMNTVRVLTQATTAEFEALTDQAKELGATTKFSATEAAEGMNFLAKAGFDANEVLTALPDTLTLAAAANLDLATSADIVSNILSGLQLDVEDLGKATDVLTQAFTSSNTDLRQLGQAFKFVGPIATTAGLEFEEIATILSFLADAGIQASMAGTTLRGAISQLLTPSGDAKKILDELGVSVADADGSLRPFTEIIDALQPIANDATKIMTLFGQRAANISIVLRRGSKDFREFGDTLRNSAGRAAEVAAAQMKGLAGAIILMQSAIDGAVLAIGEELAPTLVDAANAIALFGRNIAVAILGLKDTSEEAGEAAKTSLQDLVPSAISLVRAINEVRKAWLGLSITASVVEKVFLEMFVFLNRFVIGPMKTAFLTIGATIAQVASFIKRTFSAALSFVLVQLSKLANEAGKIANKLPTDAARELNKTFTVLAISSRLAANELKSVAESSEVADEVQKAYTRNAEEQAAVLDKLNVALESNAENLRVAGIEVAKLDQQTEALEGQFRRTTTTTKEQTDALKAMSVATRQATKDAEKAAQAFKSEINAILAFGMDPRDTGFEVIRTQLAEIGPNAVKAGQDFEAAFENARTASQEIRPEQFSAVEEQTLRLRELIRVFGLLPEAARASFDGQVAAIVDGTKTGSEVLAGSLQADSLARRQAASRDLSVAGGVFGALANLAATEGKKGFEIAKGLRIAETIINGLAASIRVFADPTIPFGVAAGLSAAIIANTFATVRKIQSTQPGGGGGAGGGGGLGGAGGGGGGGQPGGLVVPAEQEQQAGGQRITISVAGFIGNEAELASQLSNVIREAQGDGVDFGLELSRG